MQKIKTFFIALFLLIFPLFIHAEAFKGGPSDAELKVMFFVLLVEAILLILASFSLTTYIFTQWLKQEHSPKTNIIILVLFSLLGVFMISNYIFTPMLILIVLMSAGFLIAKGMQSKNSEYNVGALFGKSLLGLIVWSTLGFLIILGSIF